MDAATMPDYSKQISDATLLLSHALLQQNSNLRANVKDLDSLLKPLLQQIGLAVTKEITQHFVDEFKVEAKAALLPLERHPTISFHCLFGTYQLESPYFYDGPTHCSWRPVKDVLGLTHNGRSLAVERALTDFGAEESFGQAAIRFEEHYGWEIGRTTVLRVVEARAEQVEQYVSERLETEEKKFEEPMAKRPGEERLLVEVDGCEIRTGVLKEKEGEERTKVRQIKTRQREESWRDVRVGLARRFEEVEKTYVAKMDKYPEVMGQLFSAAVERGLSERTEVYAVGDGGNGMKEELSVQFVKLHYILDEPHLKEHLNETAEAMGKEGEGKKEWVEKLLARLSREGGAKVAVELSEYKGCGEERVVRLGKYIEKYKEGVEYEKYRREGIPCGSGEVESAHRYIPQKRLKIAGACWHPETINPMLALRIVRANSWWKDFWKQQASLKRAV